MSKERHVFKEAIYDAGRKFYWRAFRPGFGAFMIAAIVYSRLHNRNQDVAINDYAKYMGQQEQLSTLLHTAVAEELSKPLAHGGMPNLDDLALRLRKKKEEFELEEEPKA